MTTVPGWPAKIRNPTARSRLTRVLGLIYRLEDLLIAVLLTATMGLALYQIILRNLMGTGMVWGGRFDPYSGALDRHGGRHGRHP